MKIIKEGLLALISVMLFTHAINAQTWEEIGFKLPKGDTASFSSVITFANKDIGWLVTYTGNNMSKLFKTTNGGKSWQFIRTIKKDAFFVSAVFSMEPDFFYMINTDSYLSVGYDARFTTDGGITWDSTEISNEEFRLLHFYTEEKGVAIGGIHSWITTDKGRTWEKKSKVMLESDIYFYNERLGWMAGSGPNEDGGHIAKTTDGGITWEYNPRNFPPLDGIAFIDSLKGFAVDGTGGCFKTTDGGENWADATTPDNRYGIDVEFLDDKNGWISGWGQIYKTADGGETWNSYFDNYINYRLVKLIMLKEDKTAYILGVNIDSNSATLFKADLNSITGVEENKEEIPDRYYLAQNYPNPFNPSTVISYQLPVNSYVTLKIYDELGREIVTLAEEAKTAGYYESRFSAGTSGNGSSLASGIYIYRLTANSMESGEQFVKSGKMMLVK